MSLESHLRAGRAEGRTLLVPYVTGGLGAGWLDVVRAVAAAGADAVEIGIPFSDPVMDGATIQEASQRALELGATPAEIIADTARLDVSIPLVVMTYYNPVQHAGHERFASSLADSGIAGAIVPDLPLDELDGWGDVADRVGVETVLLAAPTTTDARLRAICERSRGFVYGVALMGVTGERRALATQAGEMGRRCKSATDKPVLLGVGISTPEQACQAAESADGVIVGSALVRRLLQGGGPDAAAAFVGELRAALDDRDACRGVRVVTGREAYCDLCEAARITPWFHEDDICWIAECEICAVPMVVWRDHGVTPPEETLVHMHAQLAAVVAEHFTFEHYVDDNMRNIPDHYHAHARPKGGFFGHNLRRR